MAPDAPASGGDHIWFGPWSKVGLALALVGLAAFLHAMPWSSLELPRFLLIFIGMLLAGGAVQQMMRRLRPAEEARLEVGSLTAVASLVPLLGYLGTNKDWDSAHMVLVALIIAGVLGTGLILLPVAYRKVAVVLLILVHFGGILTAVLSVPAGGQASPWLISQAWIRVYQPYLTFMYLNNAYHFYSPEPGPPTLMWAYVIFDDGKDLKGKWYRFPDRETSPVPLHFQRLLSLTESINQMSGPISDQVYQEKLANRQRAGEVLGIPLIQNPGQAPYYAEPQPESKRLLASYARHLARTHEQLGDEPEFKFHSVKIYRVIHRILEPYEMAMGGNPTDKALYFPYFQGEFNSKGEVIYGPAEEILVDADGKPITRGLDERLDKKDPFLYWLIPIVRTSPPDPKDPTKGLEDYLEEHAKYMPAKPKAADAKRGKK
jgi:hypothetical protein